MKFKGWRLVKKEGNSYLPVEEGVSDPMIYTNTTGQTLHIYIPAKYRVNQYAVDGKCVKGYIFMAVEEV